MAEELVDGKKSKKKGGIKDYKNLTGRQKAAIFLVAIGSDVASDVMKHLREDEVETLTFEIARLDTIDADFKDQVLEEFQELMQAQNFITTGGIDFARELLEKSLGEKERAPHAGGDRRQRQGRMLYAGRNRHGHMARSRASGSRR